MFILQPTQHYTEHKDNERLLRHSFVRTVFKSPISFTMTMGLNLLPNFVFGVLSWRKMKKLEVGNNPLTVRPLKSVTSLGIQKLQNLFSKRCFNQFPHKQLYCLNFPLEQSLFKAASPASSPIHSLQTKLSIKNSF